jgi:hypothetical protein
MSNHGQSACHPAVPRPRESPGSGKIQHFTSQGSVCPVGTRNARPNHTVAAVCHSYAQSLSSHVISPHSTCLSSRMAWHVVWTVGPLEHVRTQACHSAATHTPIPQYISGEKCRLGGFGARDRGLPAVGATHMDIRLSFHLFCEHTVSHWL